MGILRELRGMRSLLQFNKIGGEIGAKLVSRLD